MSFRQVRWWSLVATSAALFGTMVVPGPHACAQDELPRKVKTRINPVYPALAKQMSISGIVKVQVTIAPNGTVKATKLVGGHPLLVNAVLDAIKRWRFETGPDETTGIVEFKFDPSAGTQ